MLKILYLVVIVLMTLIYTSACTVTTVERIPSAPYSTATTYPASTPYPTHTPVPIAEAFLNALYGRIQIDDTIPDNGKDPVLALTDDRSTFAFESGLILQLIVDLPDSENDFKKTAVLLIGNAVITANEHGILLDGVEVVFYTPKDNPWLAMASVPPWQADQLSLIPLHPEYLERLQEMGLITPTPEPTY